MARSSSRAPRFGATSIDYHRLDLPNEEDLRGAGVYYGAGASEAALCAGHRVVVVGGGNPRGRLAKLRLEAPSRMRRGKGSASLSALGGLARFEVEAHQEYLEKDLHGLADAAAAAI